SVLLNTFAFEDTFRGGVSVSTGDLNADGKADVIAAAGFTGGPRVQVFAGGTGAVLSNFFAYGEAERNGVRAAAFDATANGTLDVVTTDGPGAAADPKAFNWQTLAPVAAPNVTALPASVVTANPVS